MADAQFRDIVDEERQAEQEWEAKHAALNSALCHKLALEALRRKFEAGEPIDSREYGPRSEAA